MYDRVSDRGSKKSDAAPQRAAAASRPSASAERMLKLQSEIGNSRVIQMMRASASPGPDSAGQAAAPVVQRAGSKGGSRSSSRGSSRSQGSSSGEEREYKKHIDTEVDRLFAQYLPWIPVYRAKHRNWLSWQNDWNYISDHADENDAIALLDGYLGAPGSRSEADIAHDLKKVLRRDLKTTSKETMGHARKSSQNAKGKLVLGRTRDTGKWGEYQTNKDEDPSTLPLEDRMNRKLNTTKWSVPVNYAWVEGGVADKAIFKIITPLHGPVESALRHGRIGTAKDLFALAAQEKDRAIYDTRKTEEEGGPETMLGHELLQLIRAGYTFTTRASAYGLAARLIAVPPGGHAVDDKRVPLTLEM